MAAAAAANVSFAVGSQQLQVVERHLAATKKLASLIATIVIINIVIATTIIVITITIIMKAMLAVDVIIIVAIIIIIIIIIDVVVAEPARVFRSLSARDDVGICVTRPTICLAE